MNNVIKGRKITGVLSSMTNIDGNISRITSVEGSITYGGGQGNYNNLQKESIEDKTKED